MQKLNNQNELDIKIIEINEDNEIYDFIPKENHCCIQIDAVLSENNTNNDQNQENDFDFGESNQLSITKNNYKLTLNIFYSIALNLPDLYFTIHDINGN